MTTVAQMIEWMKTMPQDAEVECGVEVQKDYSAYMSMVPVDIECCNVFDYTDEKYREYPAIFGKVIIQINGE
jgi:hypothetical protein